MVLICQSFATQATFYTMVDVNSKLCTYYNEPLMGFYFAVQIQQDSAHINTMLICNFRPSQMHVNLLNLLFSTVISDQTLLVISIRLFCKKAIVTPLHQTPSIYVFSLLEEAQIIFLQRWKTMKRKKTVCISRRDKSKPFIL